MFRIIWSFDFKNTLVANPLGISHGQIKIFKKTTFFISFLYKKDIQFCNFKLENVSDYTPTTIIYYHHFNLIFTLYWFEQFQILFPAVIQWKDRLAQGEISTSHQQKDVFSSATQSKL